MSEQNIVIAPHEAEVETPTDPIRFGRVFPARTPLFHQGDNVSHFYKIKSGVVMIYRLLADSQRQITGFCTAGDFIGLSPDTIYHNTAMTVTTANLISLSYADIESDRSLQSELFKRTCRQLEEAQNMMMTLSKKSANEKVAAFLVMLAKRQGVCGEAIDLFLPMSRLDIADYLGLTIETVSRRLTYLKTEGVITLPNRHTVKVNQIDLLENMAGALV